MKVFASSSVPWRRSKCFAWWETRSSDSHIFTPCFDEDDKPKAWNDRWMKQFQRKECGFQSRSPIDTQHTKPVEIEVKISIYILYINVFEEREREREWESERLRDIGSKCSFLIFRDITKFASSLLMAILLLPGTQPCSFALAGEGTRSPCTSQEPHMCKWSELVFCNEAPYTEKKCSA